MLRQRQHNGLWQSVAHAEGAGDVYGVVAQPHLDASSLPLGDVNGRDQQGGPLVAGGGSKAAVQARRQGRSTAPRLHHRSCHGQNVAETQKRSRLGAYATPAARELSVGCRPPAARWELALHGERCLTGVFRLKEARPGRSEPHSGQGAGRRAEGMTQRAGLWRVSADNIELPGVAD